MGVWISCIDCDYDECVSCSMKRQSKSAAEVQTSKHKHELKPITPGLTIQVTCSLCPGLLRCGITHHYCPTCTTIPNFSQWYFECTACHHRRQTSDTERPKFTLNCLNVDASHVTIPFPQPRPPTTESPSSHFISNSVERRPGVVLSSPDDGGVVFYTTE